MAMGSPKCCGAVTYQMTLSAGLSLPTAILNTALFDDGVGHVLTRTAGAFVNGLEAFLPVMRR